MHLPGLVGLLFAAFTGALTVGCSSESQDFLSPSGPNGGGGSAAGGNAAGGNAAGGNAAGGNATGGSATGGSAAGGNATGGNAAGGSAAGGSGSGGGGGGAVVNPFRLAGKMPDSAHAFCINMSNTQNNNVIQCPTMGSSFGQDGTYLINVPTYTVVDDVVTDSVTGLSWTKDAEPSMTHPEATAHCDGLGQGGFTDWRLPARVELVSIWDFGTGYPYVDSTAFTQTPAPFWSTSSSTAGKFWLVYFQGAGGALEAGVGFGGAVRCVRGAVGFSDTFMATADTVIDSATGLEWTRTIVGGGSFNGGIAGCEALELDNKTDWRLPNSKEIYTVIDEAFSDPPVDPAYFDWSNSPNQWLWTSTPKAGLSTWAFFVSLTNGASVAASNRFATERYVCVRGG